MTEAHEASNFGERVRLLYPLLLAIYFHGRLNNEEVYHRIQNFREIEDRFGKYGRLLQKSFL